METENSNEGKKCKIKKVITGGSLINPLLINIDNRPLTTEELNDYECSWYEHDTDKSTRVVNFSTNKKDYEGIVEVRGNTCKTMIVLQNKKTNKVQLIDVNECQLGRMTQKPNLQTYYDNDEIETTYEDNRSMLLKAFGSKKSKRVSDIGSKMRINTDLMSSQIEYTAADIEVDVKELELADSSVDTCLPPCHRDATNAAGVYLLEDFFLQSEFDSMEDEAFTITNLMPFTAEESGYSQFFVDSLERLQNKVNMERIKTLLYVDALIKFINIPSMKVKKKNLKESICPYSGRIAKKIFEEYTAESAVGRLKNENMEDKLVIHIIVLIIIACDFHCNTEELSKYLPKYRVKKIGQIARALCLSTRDKVTWFLKLPLPQQRSVFLKKRK